jgi:hypothetical protein
MPPARPRPYLVVETRTRCDRWSETHRRVAQFLRAGTAVVWVVDIDERAALVFRPNQFPQVFDEEDEDLTGEEAPDFRCQVSEFFAMPGG